MNMLLRKITHSLTKTLLMIVDCARMTKITKIHHGNFER